MMFRKRNKESIEITLRNQTIQYKESTQFLGYSKQQIELGGAQNRVRAKAKRLLNTIKVVGSRQKVDRRLKTLKKLYNAI